MLIVNWAKNRATIYVIEQKSALRVPELATVGCFEFSSQMCKSYYFEIPSALTAKAATFSSKQNLQFIQKERKIVKVFNLNALRGSWRRDFDTALVFADNFFLFFVEFQFSKKV